MQVNVMVFGQIAEITGNSNFVIDVADTDQLINKLNSLYPTLQNAKYAVAVNRQIIRKNTEIINGSEIAILPPFSGG
ncbi:MAG TPA: MoaD/ThiS family protein [Parafilimonas sp.]|nr:MoaD/ThiS family protein [Parafilimonas sp.]